MELISLGTNNRFIIESREVFYTATNKNTKYVILVYSNTRGILEFSEKNEDLTDQLMHTAELLYLQVIEYFIITKEGFYSFSMNGVLDELEHSKKYAVYFIFSPYPMGSQVIKYNITDYKLAGRSQKFVSMSQGNCTQETSKVE